MGDFFSLKDAECKEEEEEGCVEEDLWRRGEMRRRRKEWDKCIEEEGRRKIMAKERWEI